jgi:hypothetical protein
LNKVLNRFSDAEMEMLFNIYNQKKSNQVILPSSSL